MTILIYRSLGFPLGKPWGLYNKYEFEIKKAPVGLTGAFF